MTAARRRAVYALALAAVGVLVAYGWLTTEQGDVWLALGAAVLALLGASGPVTALRHVTPDADPDDAPEATEPLIEPLILPAGDDSAVPDDEA